MPPPLQPGQVLADRFQLQRLLGQGGMGTVWAALNLVMQKPVALKVINGEVSLTAVQRFVQEARLGSAVEHPNVVAIHDVVITPEGWPLMVMDLLHGESLAERLERSGPLELGEMVSLLLPALDGIGAAHRAQVVHRDLKPANLFLHELRTGKVELRVLDFGLAKLTAPDASGPSALLTQTGAIVGTPAYMSPEQVRKERRITPKIDIWALGTILYECLTGTRAFPSDEPFPAILSGSVTPLHERLPQLPLDVERLISRMLSVDPARRPGDVGEVAEVLARFAVPATGIYPSPSLPASAAASLAVSGSAATELAVATGRAPIQLPPEYPLEEVLPRRRNLDFTGRGPLLEELHARLGGAHPSTSAHVIEGLGGIGKTEIALEYAYRYAAEYSLVGWLRAADRPTLAADYVALASRLGLPEAQDLESAVRAVRRVLSTERRCLLIFDNAIEPEDLEPFLPHGRSTSVIITTRRQSWPSLDSSHVRGLDSADAVAFLSRRARQIDHAAARHIADLLGGLPLALAQAAAYMFEAKKPMAGYAQLLERGGLTVLERGKAHDSERTIGTTWALALGVLKMQPDALELLALCAFLAPEGIQLDDLSRASTRLSAASGASLLPARVARVLADELARDDAKIALLRYSLIGAEGDSITVHRLVQSVVRAGLTPAQQREYLSAAIRLLRVLLDCDCEDVRNWPLCSRWIPHARVAAGFSDAPASDTAGCLALETALGDYAVGRGDYAEAERAYGRGLALAEAEFGPQHISVAPLANGLALVLKATDHLVEAEQLYRRAMQIHITSGGEKHSDLARVENNLAVLLMDTGRLEEAELLYRSALAWHEAEPQTDTSELARVYGNLAIVLHKQERFSEAEPLLRRALAIDEGTFGPAHPRVAIKLNNLARLLPALGRPSEGEELLRRALAIDEAALGPSHRNVGIRLNNLGNLLAELGRSDEAAALLRRAVQVFEDSVGPTHSRTLKARTDLERVHAAAPSSS